MKLHNCIVMGKFCGLTTVEECIDNIRRHWHSFTKEDLEELTIEVNAYYDDKLKINWDAVDADMKKQEEEFEEYCKNNPPTDEELELF